MVLASVGTWGSAAGRLPAAGPGDGLPPWTAEGDGRGGEADMRVGERGLTGGGGGGRTSKYSGTEDPKKETATTETAHRPSPPSGRTRMRGRRYGIRGTGLATGGWRTYAHEEEHDEEDVEDGHDGHGERRDDLLERPAR